MVAAYALGVLAPAVAFACADRASIDHVLSKTHGGVLVLHFHDHDGDGTDHPIKRGEGSAHHCCGFVSLPGLEPEANLTILPPQATTAILPRPEPFLSGSVAPRLDRPPNALLIG